MARKRKKINRKKDKAPQTSIEEYARSTADLLVRMCKMAGENDCIDPVFSAFRHQIDDVLDEHQRGLIETLFYECYQDLRSIRGSEKSSSNSPTEVDADHTEAPEPVPKEAQEKIRTKIRTYPDQGIPLSTPRTVTDDGVDRTLFGYGVKESEASGKFFIDKLLEKGHYTKQDIIWMTGLNKDTVRKRIAYIQKHIPEVVIHKNTQGSTEPILRAELAS